jgi:hypothetical protein
MTIVVTFDDYTPVPRFDNVPWTNALIEESSTVDGTYTLIDTIALSPVDPDPAVPAARSFTTALGTAADYWYRVSFQDATLATSLPSVPLQNSAVTSTLYATTSELALILHVTEASNTVPLTRVIAAASAEIDSELGRGAAYSSTDIPALVTEVCLERAVEHWQQMKSPFGVLGLGAESGPIITASDSWNRFAHKLAPLKVNWGIA